MSAVLRGVCGHCQRDTLGATLRISNNKSKEIFEKKAGAPSNSVPKKKNEYVCKKTFQSMTEPTNKRMSQFARLNVDYNLR